jgi:hypothetical protein
VDGLLRSLKMLNNPWIGATARRRNALFPKNTTGL